MVHSNGISFVMIKRQSLTRPRSNFSFSDVWSLMKAKDRDVRCTIDLWITKKRGRKNLITTFCEENVTLIKTAPVWRPLKQRNHCVPSARQDAKSHGLWSSAAGNASAGWVILISEKSRGREAANADQFGLTPACKLQLVCFHARFTWNWNIRVSFQNHNYYSRNEYSFHSPFESISQAWFQLLINFFIFFLLGVTCFSTFFSSIFPNNCERMF